MQQSHCTSLSYRSAEYFYDGAGDITSVSTGQNGYTVSYDSAADVTKVTSVLPADSTHPAQFLQAATYTPNGGAASLYFGNSTLETYNYAPRWATGMQLSGYSPSTLPKGRSTVTLSGSEQTLVQTTPGAAATAVLTISGAEQDSITYTPLGCVQTASLTLAPPSLVSVGTVQPQATLKPCTGSINHYDTGTITVTVTGISASTAWGSSSAPVTLATNLASAINAAGMPVTATASGSNVILQARVTGTPGNYAVSMAAASTNSIFYSSPSFSISGPSALSGGTTGTSTTTYDTGQVGVTVNGSVKTVSFGQGDSSSTVVSRLASAINNDSSFPVTATAVGSSMLLSARIGGSIGNYSLSATSTWDTGLWCK